MKTTSFHLNYEVVRTDDSLRQQADHENCITKLEHWPLTQTEQLNNTLTRWECCVQAAVFVTSAKIAEKLRTETVKNHNFLLSDTITTSSFSAAGSSKGETLNYWTICPNPFQQSRPSPVGNEDRSQECALKCQGLQTEAANLHWRGSHWRCNMSTSSTQKTSGPTPTQMALQQKPPEMGEVACT